MTYLDYILLFQERDSEQPFSDGATRLYLKLLDTANRKRWPDCFSKSDPWLADVCGCSVNPLKARRAELVQRGLLIFEAGGQGKGDTATYRLLSGKVSDSDTLPPNKVSAKVSDSDTLPGRKVSRKVSAKVSDSDTPKEDKKIEDIKAAHAAPSPSSLSAKKSGDSSPKKMAARAEEVAALPLPHPGAELAALWATFRAGPKQAKKPLSAFVLMLQKLGKYPETFALVMLEAAIQGDWSGVENGGTAKAYAEWQAEQARRPPAPPRPPAATATPPAAAPPELNHDFLAQQAAREQAALDALNADWQQAHASTGDEPPVNPPDSAQQPA